MAGITTKFNQIPEANSTSKKTRKEAISQLSLSSISIDTQSFVNLGRSLAESTMTACGGSSNDKLGASGSFLSGGGSDSDPDGLKDFAQIFHPVPAANPGGSCSLMESTVDTFLAGTEHADDDDNDSVLPALPRSPSPESSTAELDDHHLVSNHPVPGSGNRVDWVSDDAQSVQSDDDRVQQVQEQYQGEGQQLRLVGPAMAAVGGISETTLSAATPSLRESWLHIMDSSVMNPTARDVISSCDDSAVMISSRTLEHVQHDEHGMGTAEDGAPSAHESDRSDGDCGCCIGCGLDKAIALAQTQLQRLAELTKRPIGEVGTEALARAHGALSRGQEAVTKLVESVPQAPVRDWLGRIAGSLVLGAFIGGVITYFVFTPVITTPVYSSCNAGPSADGARFGPAAWTSVAGEQHAERNRHHPSQYQHQHEEKTEMSVESEDYIGDRLDDALFAARAGEAAAQQGLLEEVRNILAATGKSGGISAEQLLRQFNARRFAEASKAWSAATEEATGGGDPVFFMPPNGQPTYTPSEGSQQSTEQYHSSQADGASVDIECSAIGDVASCRAEDTGIGGSSSSHRNSFGTSRRPHRACRGGGWVC